MFVQVPAPAGERWNWAEATPEPASAELEETMHGGARDVRRGGGRGQRAGRGGGVVGEGEGGGGAGVAGVVGAGDGIGRCAELRSVQVKLLVVT